MRRSAIALRAGFLLLCVAAAFLALGLATASAKKRVLRPNPANEPALIGVKMDPNRYDGAGKCRKRPPAGTKALIKWMKQNTKRRVVFGTVRWGLDARKKKQKRMADRVINTWLAKDDRGRRNALARRMGVQLIIWNCRWWQAGDRGWQRYSACRGTKNPDPRRDTSTTSTSSSPSRPRS